MFEQLIINSPPESYESFLAAEANEVAAKRKPLRLLLVFLLVFFSLQYSWEMSRGTPIESLVIHDATVKPAVWLISLITPDSGVEAQGFKMVSPQGRLNILNGCEGLETLFLLIAAFVAYPMSWKKRFIGLSFGLLIVFVANQARIVGLWYAFLYDRSLFGALHGVVLPLVLVAICLLFFMTFLAQSEPKQDALKH